MLSEAARERQLNPFPWYKTMRATSPVYQDPRYGNWHVFSYEAVQRVLSEYATFSSQYQGEGEHSAAQPLAASMINTDPPRHRQLRTLVSQAFTPRAVEGLGQRISRIVDELLDNVTPAGSMDVVGDLSYPLPVIVIAELLGIPSEDRERFKRWSDATVSSGSEGMEHPGHAMREMSDYFVHMIEQRRREPGEDMISALLAAEIDGQHLTLPELLGFGSLLLVAGNETTTNLIGNALLCFTEHPDTWERLRAEPSLLPQAIEEVLRYRSPVQSMFRLSIDDTMLGGQLVPQGSFMIAWIGSANHDEAQFPDPERFDITRSPNRHIAFGYGIHYCLGAPLARLEAKIALGAMLARFRRVARVPDVSLDPLASDVVYGVRSLPITFDKA